MQTVHFRGHEAYPSTVCAGVSEEYGIEHVNFELPVTGIGRLYIKYKNGDVDIFDLEDGVWTVTDTVTAHPGVSTAYVTITDGHGGYMWKSREFNILVYELDDIDGDIGQQYPSAIQRALDEIQQMKEDTQYYAERASEVWDQKIELNDDGTLRMRYGTEGAAFDIPPSDRSYTKAESDGKYMAKSSFQYEEKYNEATGTQVIGSDYAEFYGRTMVKIGRLVFVAFTLHVFKQISLGAELIRGMPYRAIPVGYDYSLEAWNIGTDSTRYHARVKTANAVQSIAVTDNIPPGDYHITGYYITE